MNYMKIINISTHHYRETRSTASVFFPVFVIFSCNHHHCHVCFHRFSFSEVLITLQIITLSYSVAPRYVSLIFTIKF